MTAGQYCMTNFPNKEHRPALNATESGILMWIVNVIKFERSIAYHFVRNFNLLRLV